MLHHMQCRGWGWTGTTGNKLWFGCVPTSFGECLSLKKFIWKLHKLDNFRLAKSWVMKPASLLAGRTTHLAAWSRKKLLRDSIRPTRPVLMWPALNWLNWLAPCPLDVTLHCNYNKYTNQIISTPLCITRRKLQWIVNCQSLHAIPCMQSTRVLRGIPVPLLVSCNQI